MLGDYLLLKRDRSDQNCAFVADTFTVPDQASVEALKQYILRWMNITYSILITGSKTLKTPAAKTDGGG